MLKDIEKIRSDFPVLQATVHGKRLVYLDNAATTQMPIEVVKAMEEHSLHHRANVHRGVHHLSELSTEMIERARLTAMKFIGAKEPEEIVFTSGSTHSINLVAGALRETLRPGDEVIVTELEHHSNLCPWQDACRRSGASLKVAPIDEGGDLDLGALEAMISERTKLVAVAYCSNVLGTVNPVREIVRLARKCGAAVLVDAAQMMRHAEIDVQTLGCDFLCFSGHKVLGPFGTGVLYGRRAVLEQLMPAHSGGGMVETADFGGFTATEPPFRFEAGTPNVTGIVGLEAAINYLESLGMRDVAEREKALISLAWELLAAIEGVRPLGKPRHRAGVLSFVIDGISCYDASRLLDQLGIAVRSGHHCAQPLHRRLGLEGSVRVSPAFYNTEEEIGRLAAGLERIVSLKRRAKG